MHQQIRRIIEERLLFTPGSVLVELTAGEQTPLGRLLYKVYYQTKICDVIDNEHRWGYPHNGGMHTFTYKGPWKDAVAMLELIKETLMENFTLDEEQRQVASELSYISQEIIAGRKKM